jgi:hypothetical protein
VISFEDVVIGKRNVASNRRGLFVATDWVGR